MRSKEEREASKIARREALEHKTAERMARWEAREEMFAERMGAHVSPRPAKPSKAVAKAASELGIKISRGAFQAASQSDVPVLGATATLDRGENTSRITATRAAVMGPFALAARKRTAELFVTIEGTDGSVQVHAVPSKLEAAARRLEAALRTAGQ